MGSIDPISIQQEEGLRDGSTVRNQRENILFRIQAKNQFVLKYSCKLIQLSVKKPVQLNIMEAERGRGDLGV
jgi:hypothetical protein